LFWRLECDWRMLRARGRVLTSLALVDAIASEPDHDDWSELEAMHRAQAAADRDGRDSE
jgi:hypothetical protein